MTGKLFPTMVIVTLFSAIAGAQTISVDMDTASGIQSEITLDDTAATLVIPLRISDAADLFSYEFKVFFDTGSFTYIGAQQDFGIIGEKNILAGNGGSIIPICQLQTNPPAPDTVVFGCTITGTDAAKSVSGDGLAGVLYLKSKLHRGDSAAVTVSHGSLATYGGNATPVTAYAGGRCIIAPSTSISTSDRSSIPTTTSRRELVIQIGGSEQHFTIPVNRSNHGANLSIALFSLEGKALASYSVTLSDSRHLPVTLPSYAPGAYLCTIFSGDARVSRAIQIP